MDIWSIGELAAQTGLTVRTLHHYDEIGLARPSQRSIAGHRRYTAQDVRRLHRIVALRDFGFTLAEIGGLIEEMTTVNSEEFEKMAEQRRAMTAKLSPQELAEMAARRQAAWDELTVEQQVELIRSRPPVPH
jgi:DNA-binding transcriptional MerR regulator